MVRLVLPLVQEFECPVHGWMDNGYGAAGPGTRTVTCTQGQWGIAHLIETPGNKVTKNCSF